MAQGTAGGKSKSGNGRTGAAPRTRKQKTSQAKQEKPRKEFPWHEILGIFFIAAGFFLMYCTINPVLSGNIGYKLGSAINGLMGWAGFSVPFLVIIIGARFIYPFRMRVLVLTSLLVLVCVWSAEVMRNLMRGSGSIWGRTLKDLMVKNVGIIGTYIIMDVVCMASLLLFVGLSVRDIIDLLIKLGKALAKALGFLWKIIAAAATALGRGAGTLLKTLKWGDRTPRDGKEIVEDLRAAAQVSLSMNLQGTSVSGGEEESGDYEDEEDYDDEEDEKLEEDQTPEDTAPPKVKKGKARKTEADEAGEYAYKIPPLTMLEDVDSPRSKKSPRDYSRILVDTLASFGVQASVINIERGPSVTRYELQPGPGVKVNKFTSLQNDIALVLAAQIRIEAPVPGKSCVGIEVPNERIDMVTVKEMLSAEEFQRRDLILPVALGKDITGKPIIGDLVKMPHLLVAGSTGSGKSVCVNCIIASLLFHAFPTTVQMVMIDPKRVELSIYEGIPHLIDIKATPDKKIITDPKIATLVLQQMTEIMAGRYDEFSKVKARNIFEYNKKAPVPLPYLLVIVDELADLMMVSSQSVEKHICRLAQLGRAAGIHLILATQRPSVDVITGLIKVNVPSRIAFAVTSQVDSRTILDRVGAEKLLGKGDMLYLPSDAAAPKRVQGAYISSEDIEAIVAFWQEQPPPDNLVPISVEPRDIASGGEGGEDDDSEDELYPEALRIILAERHASVSILQRKLKIGYARAGRLIDLMERKGIVGPADGSKARKIIVGTTDAAQN
ncbi:MAG: DNA translocase FtsK [Candidatus Eremiobacteraeota bacterium]|nr:DNA translocase FtsK [Candidatus Eremiobacteraeota bacterium]